MLRQFIACSCRFKVVWIVVCQCGWRCAYATQLIMLFQPKPARSNQIQPNQEADLVGVWLELVGFGWSGAPVGYSRNIAGCSTLGLVGAAAIYPCACKFVSHMITAHHKTAPIAARNTTQQSLGSGVVAFWMC